MHKPSSKSIPPAALALALAAGACGDSSSPARPSALTESSSAKADGSDGTSALGPDLTALRRATARFHDVSVAYAAGYTTENEPCVASPEGTMGVHAPNFALLGDPALDPLEPELLLYLPKPNGGFKLVGVEYFRALLRNRRTGVVGPRFESAPWNPAEFELVTPMPELFGQGFHLTPPPVPGVPWHWALHVWVWAHNPSGMFADWNPSIHCD